MSQERGYTFEIVLGDREDVSNYFGSRKYLKSGYYMKINHLSERVDTGEYQVGILVRNSQLGIEQVIMSNFRILI